MWDFGGEEVEFWVICEGKKWDFSEEKWDLVFCEEKSGIWGGKGGIWGILCGKIGKIGEKSGVLGWFVRKKVGFCEEKVGFSEEKWDLVVL